MLELKILKTFLLFIIIKRKSRLTGSGFLAQQFILTSLTMMRCVCAVIIHITVIHV